jgi:GNAT superfamily N-acetyltransferase
MPSIEYGIYTPGDADPMVRLLAGVRLTIVARDAGTGELTGVVLTEDSASRMPDGLAALSPAFEPIFGILHELEVEYRADRTPGPGESLHLFLLGVSESFDGRGIGQRLVAASLENGARRGYRRAVAEATNPTSQHIFCNVSPTAPAGPTRTTRHSPRSPLPAVRS